MRSFVKRAIPIAFYVALAVFFTIYLTTIDYSKFATIAPDWRYLLIALLTGLGFRYWGAFIWIVILRGLGAKNASYSRDLIHVYAKSWMGRYIPGTAPWILGKIYFASRLGISKGKLAVSSLLEAGLQILVLLLFSSVMLLADNRATVIDANLQVVLMVVMVIGVICLIPPVFNRIVAVAYRVLRRGTLPDEHLVTGRVVVSGIVLYAGGAIISGMSLYFVAKAVYPELPLADMLFIMGVGNLAGAVSMLAVFTPSGLGVREAVQLTLLSLVMPTEIALVVTVSTRVWGVAMDVCFFAAASAMKRRRGAAGELREELPNDQLP